MSQSFNGFDQLMRQNAASGAEPGRPAAGPGLPSMLGFHHKDKC